MPNVSTIEPRVRTGRRENPAIKGPRDKTVCFMLSDEEKVALDRLAFCLNLTRSGVLANIVVEFVTAAQGGKEGKTARDKLWAYLRDCEKAEEKRGALAKKVVMPATEGKKE